VVSSSLLKMLFKSRSTIVKTYVSSPLRPGGKLKSNNGVSLDPLAT